MRAHHLLLSLETQHTCTMLIVLMIFRSPCVSVDRLTLLKLLLGNVLVILHYNYLEFTSSAH